MPSPVFSGVTTCLLLAGLGFADARPVTILPAQMAVLVTMFVATATLIFTRRRQVRLRVVKVKVHTS